MAWYDRFIGRKVVEEDFVVEKLNPVQQYFAETQSSREDHTNYERYYEELEIVNRAVNMIVDDVAEIPYNVGDQRQGTNNIVKNVLQRVTMKIRPIIKNTTKKIKKR